MSIYNILDRFILIYLAIKSAIEASKTINKKAKEKLLFSEGDIKYLYDYLDIFKVFIKAITRL